MSDILVLIGGDGPEAPMAWASANAGGDVLAQGIADGGSGPPAAQPAHTVLIIPGAEARLKRLELPARTQAQARAGAPFLFEGVLADGEDMHFAVGEPRDVAGARLVAAMSAHRMRQWLDRCRLLGADPHLVALDCTIWPVDVGAIAIAVLPKRVIVTGGDAGGFSIEPALATPVFARWLQEVHATPSRIVLMGGDAEVWRGAMGAYGSRLVSAPRPDPVAELVRGAIEAPAAAPNLRQGEFAVAGRGGPPWKLWRFAALLAAAALLLQLGSLVIEGVRDTQAAAQLTDEAERDFRALSSSGGRIVNLRAQVAALTNRLDQSSRHPVLAVSQPMVEALRQHPLVRIDDVRHQAPGRDVRVQISAPDAASLEAVAALLRSASVAVEASDLPPRDGRYAVELNMEAPQ